MNLDFPLILVLAALTTGVIWLLDVLLWAPRRRAADTAAAAKDSPAGRTQKEPLIVEYSRSFFPIIMLVLVLRSFVVEPFRIPSGSMMPTLLIGDFILVNKFAYGLRLPVINTKIVDLGEPQRGDVVVFRYPKEPAIDYIKRVIGLPGDHVAYYDKMLYINGKPIQQEPVGIYTGVGSGEVMTGASLRLEELGAAEHRILVQPGTRGVEGEFVVPEGHYFVMGDNRDNSNDSRYWGPVPEENLVGKAFFIWLNWDSANGGVGWNRIGKQIE
ncbi:MAG: signal peptidase I [Gammaproteobacteria bacterium]